MVEEIPHLLLVDNLVTGYQKKQVLSGVSLEVACGEIVALIGHNGAGKSTLLKSVFGVLPLWAGSVALDGRQLKSAGPRELIGEGVVYLPQGNRVFTDLTVRENLELGGVMLQDGVRLNERIDHVLTFFPALTSRLQQRAGTLSGGEKQMLSLASSLIPAPRLLLLDEPSLGLAPQLVTSTLSQIQYISRNAGTAVLIVEQKVREVLRIAERVYVLRNGRVSYSGTADSLKDERKLRDVFL